MNDTSPYLMEEPPTSAGRAFLARALLHWCAIQDGHAPEDVAASLSPAAVPDPYVRRCVHAAVRLIGELVAAGEIRTCARPVGGGVPLELPPSAWELDDFRPRFTASALDPIRPFDAAAAPTHWIFVELDDFNRVVEASLGDVRRAAHRPDRDQAGVAAAHETTGSVPASGEDDRLVRLPELLRRTGMSRATIYRRIEQRRFPRQLPIEGNIAVWSERDVAAWISDPR